MKTVFSLSGESFWILSSAVQLLQCLSCGQGCLNVWTEFWSACLLLARIYCLVLAALKGCFHCFSCIGFIKLQGILGNYILKIKQLFFLALGLLVTFQLVMKSEENCFGFLSSTRTNDSRTLWLRILLVFPACLSCPLPATSQPVYQIALPWVKCSHDCSLSSMEMKQQAGQAMSLQSVIAVLAVGLCISCLQLHKRLVKTTASDLESLGNVRLNLICLKIIS